MEIHKILDRRKDFPIGSDKVNVNEIDYITSVISESGDQVALVLPIFFLNRRHSDIETLKELILQNWYISGIFDLSMIWAPYSGVPFNLIVFSKTKPTDVVFSNYEGKETFSGKSSVNETWGKIGDQQISEVYEHYLNEIEKWINYRTLPNKSKTNFFVHKYSVIDNAHFNVEYYDPDLLENERKLEQEKTVFLSDYFEIIIPRTASEPAIVLTPACFTYPLDLTILKEGRASNVSLKNGDVILSKVGARKSYLVAEKIEGDIRASVHTYVLRPKGNVITSEYLYLYLNSDTAKKYILRNLTGSVVSILPKKQLESIPVIFPDPHVNERAKTLFKMLYLTLLEDNVSVINRELFAKDKPTKPIQFELVQELLKRLNDIKYEQIRQIVDDDLREIDNCIHINALKSAIILSGSVLEAVLIDWLSDLDKKDYLEPKNEIKLDIMIERLAKSGYLERSLREAADNIRRLRNNVHPSKFLKSRKIDRYMAIDVVNKLGRILKVRF